MWRVNPVEGKSSGHRPSTTVLSLYLSVASSARGSHPTFRLHIRVGIVAVACASYTGGRAPRRKVESPSLSRLSSRRSSTPPNCLLTYSMRRLIVLDAACRALALRSTSFVIPWWSHVLNDADRSGLSIALTRWYDLRFRATSNLDGTASANRIGPWWRVRARHRAHRRS